jgi:hypothetical protein
LFQESQIFHAKAPQVLRCEAGEIREGATMFFCDSRAAGEKFVYTSEETAHRLGTSK